jgi:hypothetical protein
LITVRINVLFVKNRHAAPPSSAHPFVPPLFSASGFSAVSSFLAAVYKILPAVFPPFILIGTSFNIRVCLPRIDLKTGSCHLLVAFYPAHIGLTSTFYK